MPRAHKWLVVARNEYRVHTGRIRRVRPALPFIVVGLLALYVLCLAPTISDLLLDEVAQALLSQAAIALVQVVLLVVFFYFMIMPITETLREVSTGRIELLLSAPIRPSDLLLGEYLGELPFYAIVITVFAGLFAAVLFPLGVNGIQLAIVVVIFVLVALSAFWIGVVVAALLRSKLEQLAAGRDIGRALAMMIPLPLVAVLYAAWGGGLLEAISSPDSPVILRTILGALPSSWGSRLIAQFAANPGSLVVREVAMGLGGLVLFFLGALWVGARLADRAYSMEETSLSSSRARPDGLVYRSIRRIGRGRSFGAMLVSLFKDFARHLENLSSIVYILGVLVLINIFLVDSGEPEGAASTQLMVGLFLYPILIVMATGGITVDGKEKLFIYRKAPSGIGLFLRTVYIRSLLIMAPITGIPTAVLSILGGDPVPIALAYTGLIVVIVAALVAFVIGLFLINPAYTDKSPRLWINVFIMIAVQVVFFAISFVLLTDFGRLEDPIGGFIGVLSVEAVVTWITASAVFYLGKRRLQSIE